MPRCFNIWEGLVHEPRNGGKVSDKPKTICLLTGNAFQNCPSAILHICRDCVCSISSPVFSYCLQKHLRLLPACSNIDIQIAYADIYRMKLAVASLISIWISCHQNTHTHISQIYLYILCPDVLLWTSMFLFL